MINTINSACLSETIKIPVRDECDVVIAGGGAAGVMAALAAAQNGAKTILIEQNTFLGGSLLGESGAWEGFFNVFKPYYTKQVQVVRGIPELVRKQLQKRQGSTGFYEEELDNREETIRVHGDREEMPQLFLDMMKEYGVILYLSSMVVDVVKEGNDLKGIIIAGKYGREAILAKTVIDTTGNADVAYQAGVNCLNKKERRNAGIAFGMGNIDFIKVKEFATQKNILSSLGYADKGGEHRDNITRLGLKISELDEIKPYLPKYCQSMHIIITSNHENRATQVEGIRMKLDTTEVEEISKAYVTLNKCCFTIAGLLKKLIPGFENSFVDWTSPYLSIDFGRVVECEYDITREDIENTVIPEDTIGVLGVTSQGCDTKGHWYGIPYRALIPKKVNNLLVAGKIISSDDEAWESTRITGSCFLQGQAAGTAAAIAVKNNCYVSKIDSNELRETLLAMGAFLGTTVNQSV